MNEIVIEFLSKGLVDVGICNLYKVYNTFQRKDILEQLKVFMILMDGHQDGKIC